MCIYAARRSYCTPFVCVVIYTCVETSHTKIRLKQKRKENNTKKHNNKMWFSCTPRPSCACAGTLRPASGFAGLGAGCPACRAPPREPPFTNEIGTPDPQLEPQITSLDKCKIN